MLVNIQRLYMALSFMYFSVGLSIFILLFSSDFFSFCIFCNMINKKTFILIFFYCDEMSLSKIEKKLSICLDSEEITNSKKNPPFNNLFLEEKKMTAIFTAFCSMNEP